MHKEFYGFPFIEMDIFLKKRTLFERLFTLPWRPLKKFKPDDNTYFFDNKIYGHPETIKKLKDNLKINK